MSKKQKPEIQLADKILITMEEAAQMTGMSYQSIRQIIKDGGKELLFNEPKRGRKLLIKKDKFIEYILERNS